MAKRFDTSVDLDDASIIIDCSDNFTTKFLAHDMAFKFNKKFCVASIHKFEGQIQFFDFGKVNEDPPAL